MFGKGIAGLVCVVGLFVPRTQAYDARGHQAVGGIADQRLAGKPVALKIGHLLDGLTLQEAAVLPDSIKEWDRGGPDQPHTFHLPDHKVIEDDLRAFWNANRTNPSHHLFHYTDVPVADGNTTYASGKTGRSDWDIVHMIPYCAQVLKGTIPENNERKITRRVALILLAHYVGDIHQPLHVGAEYFDEGGKPANPDVGTGPFYADEGGNSLTLVLQQPDDHGHARTREKLHTYWDKEAVDTAFALIGNEIGTSRGAARGVISDSDAIRHLAVQEPAAWQLPATPDYKGLAIAWADEILPIAREAHERLEFTHIHIVHKTATGLAIERAGQGSYHDWAGKVARAELHKAGWRLAALLERVID